ncbi:MAG: DUF2076 domain-containing protein [Reyranella sp.]
MQAQERELIAGLFGRLQPFESQPRDPEAEALIKEFMARQPASAYLLVQAVLVQEHALKAAQERIAELEASAKETPSAAAPSFLGNAPRLGPWGAQATVPRTSVPTTAPTPTVPAVPPTRSPLQAALSPQSSGGGGGGFFRTAMMTAAGVAGGALLFEGIRGLLNNSSSPFGQAQASQPSPLLPPDSMPQQQQAWSDTTPADSQYQADNQYQPDDQQQDQDYQDDYDTASLDDGGADDSWT